MAQSKRFGEAVWYYIKNFGFRLAYNLVVYPRIADRIGSSHGQRYIYQLLKFQRTICMDVVEKYRNLPLSNNPIAEDYKIWTCWWQGKDQMPKVIRLCHESLQRNSNGHEVVLITKENYHQYVTLPQYILDKVDQGIISFSHFSDLIRLSLLSTHGGHWIDSALFITKPIQIEGSFHMAKMAVTDNSICQGRWCFGDMAGNPRFKVFHYMLDCLLKYWKKYDSVVDYLMFDGFLRIAYEDIPDIHECIDNLPVYSPNLHETRYHFHERYDKDKFDYLLANNVMLSLTWRIDYPTHTKRNELTYYGRLVELYGV